MLTLTVAILQLINGLITLYLTVNVLNQKKKNLKRRKRKKFRK